MGCVNRANSRSLPPSRSRTSPPCGNAVARLAKLNSTNCRRSSPMLLCHGLPATMISQPACPASQILSQRSELRLAENTSPRWWERGTACCPGRRSTIRGTRLAATSETPSAEPSTSNVSVCRRCWSVRCRMAASPKPNPWHSACRRFFGAATRCKPLASLSHETLPVPIVSLRLHATVFATAQRQFEAVQPW